MKKFYIIIIFLLCVNAWMIFSSNLLYEKVYKPYFTHQGNYRITCEGQDYYTDNYYVEWSGNILITTDNGLVDLPAPVIITSSD